MEPTGLGRPLLWAANVFSPPASLSVMNFHGPTRVLHLLLQDFSFHYTNRVLLLLTLPLLGRMLSPLHSPFLALALFLGLEDTRKDQELSGTERLLRRMRATAELLRSWLGLGDWHELHLLAAAFGGLLRRICVIIRWTLPVDGFRNRGVLRARPDKPRVLGFGAGTSIVDAFGDLESRHGSAGRGNCGTPKPRAGGTCRSSRCEQGQKPHRR